MECMDAMVTYKWEDLRGDNVPFAGQLAKGARGMFCNLWNKYPDRFTNNDPVTGPAKWYFNIVCSEEGVNRQPDPPPFSGGQCPVVYRVVTRATFHMTDGRRPGDTVDVVVEYIFNNVGGPLGLNSVQTPTPQSPNFGGSNRAPRAAVKGNLDNAWSVIGTPFYGWGDYTDNSTLSHQIVGVTRVDGLPDDCGSLPSVWKPILPTPQPGDETWNVDIPDVTGPDLTIPLGWFDIDFSVPVTLNFEVGDIVIDVGGVTVNFNVNNEWNIGENPDSSKLPDDITEDIKDTKKTVDDIKTTQEEEKKQFDKTEYDSAVYTTETDFQLNNSNIDYVEIYVIRDPKKGKVITNFSPENTFFWAGYFCWTASGSCAPQVKIEKFANFYSRPNWATGISVFCVNGSKLQINIYTKKVVPSS